MPQIKSMNNAEIFAYALKKNGVEYIFGQSNPSSITLACMDQGIRQIAYRQENTGSYMAQAYGMMTKKVPVVTAQNGPAATLLVPGLAECLKASHPMVAIVQQIPLADYDKNAFQELDHEKLFAGCAKWVKTILDEDRIEDYVSMAFVQAASGKPGPVVLLCPVNFFNNDTKREYQIKRTMDVGFYPLDRVMADPRRIREGAEKISRAQRPVIIAGGGVIASDAQEELRLIQERFSIPVATTMMGKGAVDEAHPLSMGVAGFISGKRGMAKFCRPMIESADLILLVGNRTNQNGTDSWSMLPRHIEYIHIDIDGNEIGRNYEAFRLKGDAKLTLRALAEELALFPMHNDRAVAETKIAKARVLHQEEAADVISNQQKPLRIEHFTAKLENHLQPDHIVVADASFSSIWLANYISATGNRKFIFPRGIAGLGWGLPMGMGAAIAAPERKVFCMAGDGGFAHVWSELETCCRHGIQVVCAVINNGVLGYQYWAELSKFKGRHTNACDLSPIDHAKVAEACGIKGIRLEDPAKIDEVLAEAMKYDGSVIIDVIASPDSVPPVRIMEPLDGLKYKPLEEV